MEHARPHLIANAKKDKTPLLIIDKNGFLGESLAKQLQEQFLVVLVSEEIKGSYNNIIHIPFRKKIPTIPDNYYSQMFVFYNGEQQIVDMLPSLQKKAHETNAPLLFITSLAFSSRTMFRQLGNHLYQQVRVILYGEPFSANASFQNVTSLLLYQAKTKNRLIIPDDGLTRVFPVLVEDIFAAIIGVAFDTQQRGGVIFVFPEHHVTALSIARMLKTYQSDLRLDFGKYKGNPPVYYLPSQGQYYFHQYPLEKKLQQTLGELVVDKEKKVDKKTNMPRFPTRRNVFGAATWWLIILGVLILPIVTVILSAVSGAGALQFALRELGKGNISQAVVATSFAKDAFTFSEKTSVLLFYLPSTYKTFLLSHIHTGAQGAEVANDIFRGVQLVSTVAQADEDNKGSFLEGVSLLKKSLISLQRMRAENQLPHIVTSRLESFDTVLFPLQHTIDTFPSLFGFEGKRTYLVLFQNNMELRPGGGFIGSYGLLTLDEGRVADFTVHDVYDADGQLTFHIEPPYGLRRHLGASHWFLRDSNFAIDFSENAAQAMTFLEHETGDRVDGVIAVDTTFLKNILEAMGSVTVPEYKETITAENFYLRTQTHVEKDFFPGSVQKKAFLQSLLAAMQQRLLANEHIAYSVFAEKLGESLSGKHVLFAFRDDAIQKVFTVNGLSSSLWDGRQRSGDVHLDTFGVVDANVGANKANYYVTRDISQEVTLGEAGSATTSATVTYTNTSKKDSPFGGDYKNYVQFVVPENAIVREITIDGVVQKMISAETDPAVYTSASYTKPDGLEVETTTTAGTTVVGFLVFVPIGQTRIVTVTYEVLAQRLRNDTFTYNLWLFKQPGTTNDAYSLAVLYPEGYDTLSSDAIFRDVGGKLVYSGALVKDLFFEATFSKR